jgi:hypothetical protein
MYRQRSSTEAQKVWIEQFAALNLEIEGRGHGRYEPADIKRRRWEMINEAFPGWRDQLSGSPDWDINTLIVDLVISEVQSTRSEPKRGPRKNHVDLADSDIVMEALQRWQFVSL